MISLKSFIIRFLHAFAWVYFTGLFGWLGAYLLTGDRFGYVALINALAPYLFLPLPGMVFIAWFLRRRSVWVMTGMGVVAFVWLWGGLFVPRASPAQAGDETLTVLTYNVLAGRHEIDPALVLLRAENADVVFLQELTFPMAEALQTELADLYPHQTLVPEDGVWGLGILSKYPLWHMEMLMLETGGVPPQTLVIYWNEQRVGLVNYHHWSTRIMSEPELSENFRAREMQAEILAYFAENTPYRPLVLAGDANAAPLSDAYKIMTAGNLRDVWVEAGQGWGHTFPSPIWADGFSHFVYGLPIPPSFVEQVPVPQWLVRIDYVFVSPEWVVHQARLAQFDGVSDHRGVWVELSLAP